MDKELYELKLQKIKELEEITKQIQALECDKSNNTELL